MARRWTRDASSPTSAPSLLSSSLIKKRQPGPQPVRGPRPQRLWLLVVTLMCLSPTTLVQGHEPVSLQSSFSEIPIPSGRVGCSDKLLNYSSAMSFFFFHRSQDADLIALAYSTSIIDFLNCMTSLTVTFSPRTMFISENQTPTPGSMEFIFPISPSVQDYSKTIEDDSPLY